VYLLDRANDNSNACTEQLRRWPRLRSSAGAAA